PTRSPRDRGEPTPHGASGAPTGPGLLPGRCRAPTQPLWIGWRSGRAGRSWPSRPKFEVPAAGMPRGVSAGGGVPARPGRECTAPNPCPTGLQGPELAGAMARAAAGARDYPPSLETGVRITRERLRGACLPPGAPPPTGALPTATTRATTVA